ncbi:MAG: HAD family hydrolase [Clostridia bacterium]|nr:HAD family hydrolase [Clostridia bacterium]
MQKNIIFTDCFNTIICRKVSANDVIFLWAEEMAKKYSDVSAERFYFLFKNSEKKLAQQNRALYGEKEYFLSDILDEIANVLSFYSLSSNFDKHRFVTEAAIMYSRIEKDNQFLSQKVVKFLKEKKEQGCKIYVVSDFYCGKKTLFDWLQNLGVEDLFDDIFVSCEFKKSKRTCQLYQHLLGKLGVSAGKVLMIGDNAHADYRNAKKSGLSSQRVRIKIPKTSKKVAKIKEKYSSNKIFDEIFDDFGKKLNYSNYAFPLYIFTKRLAEFSQKKGEKNVFFLAREGKFLKKLFDCFCHKNGVDIKTHYLQVSRNSVLVASLKPLNEEKFENLLKEISKITPANFLASLTFCQTEIDRIVEEAKIDGQKPVLNFLNSSEFAKIKESNFFQEIYNRKLDQQKPAFEKYLQSFDVDFEKDGMLLVDVGWKGTMQDYLQRFFGEKVALTGCYVGCRNSVGGLPQNKKLVCFMTKE